MERAASPQQEPALVPLEEDVEDVAGAATWAEWPHQKRIDEALRLKEEGNQAYREQETEAALRLYSEAIAIAPDTMEAMQRAILYGNRAAVCMLTSEWDKVVKDCSEALALRPAWHKALARRAKAYEQQDDPVKAFADYKALLESEDAAPMHDMARAAVCRLEPVAKQREQEERDKMLGQLKDLGNSILGKFGLSLDNFKMQKDPSTGNYSVNFGGE